ncbi:hypothetical protein [Streptomyces sp. NBC_00557]|uniref:hypothetical protein n=1 Tax=Streptomyces sp. NBC_00557 TaxID=2975776 RepID=UPI002E81C4BD|nr:hypothetical protein [Streptomyces sp. NBC_00557]WUC39383.1 hypothetical protein OG956_36840 [Streptomyces sp. NBC_00557]
MGWIKDAKANMIKEHAQRAVTEGRTVFVCRVNQGVLQSNFSGPLSGVAEQIEAVEELGWQLDQASFSHDHKDHASAFLTFRRPWGHAAALPQQIQASPRTTSWGAR